MAAGYLITAIEAKNQAMKRTKKKLSFGRYGPVARMFLLSLILAGTLWGCAVSSKKLVIQDSLKEFGAGTIVSAKTGLPTSFSALIDELKDVRVIYVGENHTEPAHHQVQLNVIRALIEERSDVSVGMEMFDRTYQPVLDQWSDGLLEQDEFVRKTHWYANWRYPYELYAELLDFIKIKKIRLVALNLPYEM
jgi:uncharacterized iron-regulated protein